MRAEPDGYTLYSATPPRSRWCRTFRRTASYSVADFEPIAITGLVPLVLIVSKRLQSTTLQDFIAEIRAKPGKYTYGGGLGSPPHISGAWMNSVAGLKWCTFPTRAARRASPT